MPELRPQLVGVGAGLLITVLALDHEYITSITKKSAYLHSQMQTDSPNIVRPLCPRQIRTRRGW